ncbi:MAG: ribosome-binding factor A [Opitutae bacterium]|nr:ribosome-binding factor A [Opitutae bacterium]|tara:strand:+ start:202 stop:582 length:381 start_codon:yes stop_codon:yes gene_type:complete
MGLRGERVNELIRREISDYLHVRYRAETTHFTILAARISPDLRSGVVAYSVLGDEEQIDRAAQFFKAKAGEIRAAIAKRIVLKYFPKIRFVHDDSIEKGNEVLRILDDLEAESMDSSPASGENARN